MKALCLIIIAAIIGSLSGIWLGLTFSAPYPTDCTKVNKNVRGSIEYRCACR